MLFSPYTVGPIRVKNRIVFPSIVSGFAEDHLVSERTLTWYRQLAHGGVGMVVSEAICVHPTSEAAPTFLGSYHPPNKARFAQLAEIVESADCRLVGQLVHLGRSRMLTGDAYQGIAPSAIADPYSGHVPRAMSQAEIAVIVDAFTTSAVLLAEAGFSGVELNAAHGHLLALFLSPRTNRRTDDYGGDVVNRIWILREIVKAIRAACPTTFAVGVKMIAEDGIPGGIGPAAAAEMLRTLSAAAPVDYVSFSFGSIGPTISDHIPDLTREPGPYLGTQQQLRSWVGVPTVAAGRITSVAHAERALRAGAGDLVALGRALIADPELPRKAREGKAARSCVYCNVCWSVAQTGASGLCPANPRWGRTPSPLADPTERRKVTVVGGGVTALEAAAEAAERGHTVTLLAPTRLGGRIGAESLLPGLGELALLVDQLVARAEQTGVRVVRRTTHAQVDDILATAPDLVLLATGSRTPLPGIALRQHDDVPVSGIRDWTPQKVREALSSTKRTSGTAVVVDAEGMASAYALAELLAPSHTRTVVLCAAPELASALPWITRENIGRRLAAAGVTHHVGATVTSWAGRRLAFRVDGAEEWLTDVAQLVWSERRVPDNALAEPLRRNGIIVQCLGDAAGPAHLADAIRQARDWPTVVKQPEAPGNRRSGPGQCWPGTTR